MVRQINNKAEFDSFLKDNENTLVVVDFTATWCGPCQVIGPKFATMEKEITDVKFIKVDVDEASDVSEACGITCMPTFQFYKNGAKVDEFSGADENKLREHINKNK